MDNGSYLSPKTLQIFGLAMIAVFSTYWGLTGHESPVLVGAGVTLATLGGLGGLYERTRRGMRRDEDEP